MPETLIVLLISLASLVLALGLIRVGRQVHPLRQLLIRAEVRRSESLRLQQAEQRIAEVQRLTECAVDGGTEVVRAVHRGIAAIPFGILESIPVTRDTTRIVRKTHDLISDAVYGSIGAINRGVGLRLRGKLHAGSPTEVADDSVAHVKASCKKDPK